MLVAVSEEFLEDSEVEKKWLSHSQRQTSLYASKIREENARLKEQNKRLREIIEVCQRYFDNQRVTDAWADNIKMDIDDSMGNLGMEEIK